MGVNRRSPQDNREEHIMDDMTTADMDGEGMPDFLKALLGLSAPPDPAEKRAHELAHFTDDLGMDRETGLRLLGVSETFEGKIRLDDLPDDDDELRDLVLRMSLAACLEGQITNAFNGIHRAEAMGVPLDSLTDLDQVRRGFAAFLAAWDLVVTDAAEVTVPDDASAITG